jgi:ankyrin repeat protein
MSTSANSPNPASLITIFQHCLEGRIPEVVGLLDAEPKLLKERDADGRNLLHWACSGKKLELANLLIDKGVPVDEVDDDDWSPLIIATSVGSAPLVQRYVFAGADA